MCTPLEETMNVRTIGLGLAAVTLGLTVALQTPSVAETASASTRIEKLEERVRDLEARMAKVEAAAHSATGAPKAMGDGMGQPPASGGMGGHM
jgi:hypothetical protein